MGSTKVELVKDLEEAIKAGKGIAYKAGTIMAKAQQGHYHDFESELATPKMQLHMDLLDAELPELDKKMQNGDYDDESPSPEESQRLMDLLKGEKNGK